MKRISVLVVLALAQPALAADLSQIYQDAQAQDATFATAEAAYRAGLERLPQGRAGLLPLVNLSGNVTRIYTDVDGVPSTQHTSRGYTLSLAQPLFRPQNWATYDQAKQQVLQAEAQFSAAAQDLALRVAQAYFDVLLAADNVTVSLSQKTAISEQLAFAKRNFEVGTATITDTNEAQARFDLAVAQEIADANTLEIRRQALRQLINALPDRLAPLKDRAVLPLPSPNDIDAWVAASEKNNQTLTILRAATEIARTEVRKQRAGRLPTVDLIASYNDSRNALITDNFGNRGDLKSSQIGVEVNVPLYTGGLTQSRIREALANQDRSIFDLEANQRAVAQSARAAFLGVTSGVTQVAALEQALRSAQVSLDSTKLGREVGVRTSLDVLNAEQLLSQALRDLLQSRYTVILSQLRLKAAAGQLGGADIAEVNGLLLQQ